MLIGGVISALITGALNWNKKSGADFWKEVGFSFAIGAITAPVGGLAVKVLGKAASTTLRLAFRPLLRAIGNMGPLKLTGQPEAVKLLIRMSRFFFNTNKNYPPVTNSYMGKLLKKFFPKADWEQHHVLIQQCWSKVGGPNQIYDDVAANEGLRRLGNGMWNLLPIPAKWNGWLGHTESFTALFATTYYALVAYGLETAREFMAEVFDDHTAIEDDTDPVAEPDV